MNLYLTGRAVSNVFNDTMELDSGGGQLTVLKGIHQRSDIGLMSLFEHYKSCQVHFMTTSISLITIVTLRKLFHLV